MESFEEKEEDRIVEAFCQESQNSRIQLGMDKKNLLSALQIKKNAFLSVSVIKMKITNTIWWWLNRDFKLEI